MNIASVLKNLMARNNLSETRLGLEADVPQPSIHGILTGRSRQPRDSTITPLAEYFGISLNQLKGYEPLPGDGAVDARLEGRAVPGVPVLALDNIKEWIAGGSVKSVGERIQTVSTMGPRAFAFAVTDAALEPIVSEGRHIVADPDRLDDMGDKSIVLLEVRGRIAARFAREDLGRYTFTSIESPNFNPLSEEEVTKLALVVVIPEKALI